MLGEVLFRHVDERIGLVARLDQLAPLLVLGGVGFRLLDHSLDLVLGQAARGLDAYLLLLARALVLGRDVDDAVGVDVEGDLDLRHPARRRRQADEVELAQQLVVAGHLALALEHPDRHRVLMVLGGREHLALARGDGGVAVDQPGEDPAQRLDAEAERRHVEQQHVLDVALQHPGLDGRADRHHLVGVDAAVRLAPEEVLDRLDDLGHAGHAADQDHLADLPGRQAGILERGLARLDGALDQIVDQGLELGPGQLHRQMLGAGLVGGDEGQVDLGLHRARQLDLGLLGRLLEALQREPVFPEVDALLLLELVGEVADQAHVEVLAAQEGVAVGRLDLEHAVADLEDRHVEGAAAEVVDRDGLALRLVETVGERGGGRLVDDAQHLQAGDLAGVLGRLALGVVEIGRHGDDGLGHLAAEIRLRRLLHLLEHVGADLARRVSRALGFDPGIAVVRLDDPVGHHVLVLLGHGIVETATDQALDREQGVFRVGDGLALGRLSDEDLLLVAEGDHGGGGAGALGVFDDLGVAALHDGDAGIGGTEIDADDFGHVALAHSGGAERPRLGTARVPRGWKSPVI